MAATTWRPLHAGDARAAALELRRADAIARYGARPDPRDAAPVALEDLPHRLVACPNCGRPDTDRSMLDVRALSAEQRRAFGILPDAAFLCTHVCLNDRLNGGLSLASFCAALGAPNDALPGYTAFDDANPACRRADPRPVADTILQRRTQALPFPLD